MPKYDYYDPFGTTGGGDGKYFQKTSKGRWGGYSLKPQYESRLLGYGDSWSKDGSLATYSNAYDDMWDSFEPMRDKRVYGIYEKAGFQQPAPPAPAPKAAPASAPAQVKTPDNPYKKQADDLLKTIDKILAKPAPTPPPPPKPTTIFGGSTALKGGDLQIAPAAGATKNTGTGGFKRRKTTTPTTNTLRTVQSLNV